MSGYCGNPDHENGVPFCHHDWVQDFYSPAIRPFTPEERAAFDADLAMDDFQRLAAGYRRLPDRPGFTGNWMLDTPGEGQRFGGME